MIRADGSFMNSGERLIDYTLRFFFYKGRDYVKGELILRNAAKGSPKSILFDSMMVSTPLAFTPTKIIFPTSAGVQTISSGTGYLFQGYSSDHFVYASRSCYTWDPPVAGTCVDSAYTYDESESGVEIRESASIVKAMAGSSEWADGWAKISGADSSITIGLRWMSGYWPAGFSVENNKAIIEIFPERNTKKGLKFSFGKHELREVI